MRIQTALTIKNQYPNNVKVESTQDDATKKWAVHVVRYHNGVMKEVLLTSKPVFSSKGSADQHGRDVCDSILNDENL